MVSELTQWRLQTILMITFVVVALFFTFQFGEQNVLNIKSMVSEFCGPNFNYSIDMMGNFQINKNNTFGGFNGG
jgi:hypothetical protein